MKTFKEKLHQTIFTGFRYSKKICSLKSKYQTIGIYEHDTMGKILTLDGVIQLATQDEFIFHECLAYWPFSVKAAIKNILIIGGGDLGTALRIAKLPGNFTVTIVDIDKSVTDLSLKYIFKHGKKILKDKRFTLLHEDAITFIAKTKSKYDLIIVDSTDNCGVGSVLYKNTFITDLKKHLTKDGILMRLSGSYFLQQKEFKIIQAQSKKIFGKKAVGSIFIPLNMYQGGIYTVTVCFNNGIFKSTPTLSLPIETWYNKDRHNAVSCLL